MKRKKPNSDEVEKQLEDLCPSSGTVSASANNFSIASINVVNNEVENLNRSQASEQQLQNQQEALNSLILQAVLADPVIKVINNFLY